MAKKQKVNPKSEPEPEPVPEPSSSSAEEEEPENTEEEEESSEEGAGEGEEEESSEDEEDSEEDDDEPENESSEPDRETIKKLLEPFSKDQLLEMLKQAAIKDSQILAKINFIAENDPSHRKIFVHGLGWDATNEILASVFKKYGDLLDCNVVLDKITGRPKGYGFVIFKTREGAAKALKEPQKQIGTRLASSQLASFGYVPNQPVTDGTGKKVFVSGIDLSVDIEKVKGYLSRYGELEEGPPQGLDKLTGKHKGFAVFVYKSPESAKKALEEPFKPFEGCRLHCKRAVDGLKANANANNVGSDLGLGSSSLMGLPYNQGIGGFNTGLVGNVGGIGFGTTPPAMGGLNPLASSINPMGLSSGLSATVNAGGVTGSSSYGLGLGGYGAPAGINSISPSVMSSYGSQAALGFGSYQSSQLGQSSMTKPPATLGSLGGFSSYNGF